LGKRPSLKELTLKAAGYRLVVIAYEAALAALVTVVGWTAIDFVVLNNAFKFLGYLVYELIWFGYLRTRLNVVDRVKRFLKVNRNANT